MSNYQPSQITFASLDLPEPLQDALDACQFTHCTDIQALTLPQALIGRDIAGQAQTGTGKTAAFLLATFTHLLQNEPHADRRPNQPRALILAPTRELAIQICKDAEQLGQFCDLSISLAYGGTGYEAQRRDIQEGCDILIGTPGRIIDYYKQKVFDLRKLQIAILDEADRMFDLGFISDVRYLFRRMPPPENRQSMLFSATLSHRVLELAYEHMNMPESITVEAETLTADRVEQTVYYPASDEKIPLLIGLLKRLAPPRSMVFVNTKGQAELLNRYLLGNGFQSDVLSGDVRQKKRQRLLSEFLSGKISVLIATDVAARGLHIPGITHVFNYDLPQQEEDYVHRIGRTARAGEQGDAISFACEEYAFSLPDIEQYIEHSIPVGTIDADLIGDIAPPTKPQKRSPGPQRTSNRPPRRRKKPATQSAESASPQASDEKSKPKRRRRRRRKPRQAADGQNTTQKHSVQASTEA